MKIELFRNLGHLTNRYPFSMSKNRVEGKIRSNTTVETKKGQGNLFLSIRDRLQPELSIAEDNRPLTPKAAPATGEKEAAAATTTGEREAAAYAEAAEEDQTQHSCWVNLCTILGIAPPKRSGAIAAPPPKDLEDIVVSICMCHYKLGQVHDRVLHGCCGDDDASLIRSELTKINTSLSKMTDA